MKCVKFSFLVLVLSVSIKLVFSKYLSLNTPCHESIGKTSLDFLSSKRHYFYDPSGNFSYIPEGCTTPVKFWYFGRHGTRNPGSGDIISMQEVLPKIHKDILESLQKGEGNLCSETIDQFEIWKPRDDLKVSEASFLVEQGRKELFSISSRYKDRFTGLFQEEFNNNTYYFRFTESQRTEKSAKYFSEAIFGSETNVWFPVPERADPILKFYETCPKWIEEVDKNPIANKEHDKFINSLVMNATISKISQRVGLTRNLTLQEITTIYTTCAFETAWENGTVSPWCVIFDLDDLKVMAYREDLDYYWKDGYGYEINYKQACPPFKDLVDYFERYINDSTSDQERVQGYFSHSGAGLKMLARLGLFKDSIEITSDNFGTSKDSYQWKTSNIDFMGSNIAFTLYNCPASQEKYQIGFFFQEIPTPIDACKGKAFCSFEEFRANVAGFVDFCDLEEICAV